MKFKASIKKYISISLLSLFLFLGSNVPVYASSWYVRLPHTLKTYNETYGNMPINDTTVTIPELIATIIAIYIIIRIIVKEYKKAK